MMIAVIASIFATLMQADVIPRGQSTMPGPALNPTQAMARMSLPPGFQIELVASEPDLVNPIAMCFDEKGRVWVTESIEYPRSEPGKGRDRIKILEDTDGDGRTDKVTIFAEGLNIPSGIALGHGGVWVANAPHLLFYKIGPDGKAAGKPEVVFSGFGRDDTHELPSGLTFGPDGWLYGLNGVFNPSVIKHQGKEHRFTCALWRLHPRTRVFELFSEGTSNPYGVTFDTLGNAFISACVIDHLWHLAEKGYYHRQGGPYPPHTWKLESIVRHKHQKAAYCGIHWYDSDAYPAEYRNKLYMGNIHGSCINADQVERTGSTYTGKTAPDFLTANDPWFMPVCQKTGPDGCLYILDWYDRYHCYQDARRDPVGIDRLNGRLYRIRYSGTPRAPMGLNLAEESDSVLITRLSQGNGLFRELAQRLLSERLAADSKGHAAASKELTNLVNSASASNRTRLLALWSLVSAGDLPVEDHLQWLTSSNPAIKAWAVRAAGNQKTSDKRIQEAVIASSDSENADVKLQAVVALGKLPGIDPVGNWMSILSKSGTDPILPAIIWQNTLPKLSGSEGWSSLLNTPTMKETGAAINPGREEFITRLSVLAVTSRDIMPDHVKTLARLVDQSNWATPSTRSAWLRSVARELEINNAGREKLWREAFLPVASRLAKSEQGKLRDDAELLAALLGDKDSQTQLGKRAFNPKNSDNYRMEALQALLKVGDAQVVESAVQTVLDNSQPEAFRGRVLAELARFDQSNLGERLMIAWQKLPPSLKDRVVDVLSQRPQWATAFVSAVEAGKVPATAAGVNQIRKLQSVGTPELQKRVKAVWGIVRDGRNPARENVAREMAVHLGKTRGDAVKGQAVFAKNCAVCHKFHGVGQEVGPDITSNGRASFEQLLSNVFDPSLVIGSAFQATTVLTTKGRLVSGLIVEDSPNRVTLKVQGGTLEVIPRGEVEQVSVSANSLMPEGLEKQITPSEIADLFAFLVLEKPPGTDPTLKKIPGAP